MKRGWNSSVHWINRELIIRILNPDLEVIRVYLQAFQEQAQRKGWTLAFAEGSAPGTIPNRDRGKIEWGSVRRERLTRTLLDRLPEGAFLASNVLSADGPVFAARIVGSDRSILWEQAKNSGAAHRLFRLFWSEDDFRAACQAFLLARPNLPM